MKRLPRAAGFSGQSAPVASPRLTDAVAVALALGAVSLCLMLATKAGMAMPLLG